MANNNELDGQVNIDTWNISTKSENESEVADFMDDGEASTTTGISRSSARKRRKYIDQAEKTKKKKPSKRMYLIKSLAAGNNEMTSLDLYFQSIAATVKTFPPRTVVEIKRKIYNIVEEAELNAIEEANQM